MKSARIIIMAALGTLVLSAVSANAVTPETLDFDNLTGTYISFSGASTFDFTPAGGGNQFQLTSTGPSDGLQGYVTNSDLFTIGTITGTGMGQTAPVTGSATIVIQDGTGHNLTGTLQWDNILVVGDIGGLNYQGNVNIQNIQYSGANSDLIGLASAGAANDVLSFQFTMADTLTYLASNPAQTSYSGSISVVPEPTSAGLLLLAGSACFYALLRWRRTMDS